MSEAAPFWVGSRRSAAAAVDAPIARMHAVPDPPTAPSKGLPPASRPAARLEIPPCDLAAALALSRELSVSHPFAQILVRRGLADPATARSFLNPTETHDPSAFAGIDRALELIARHLRRGNKITVHGDYDVDGVCATAVLVRALRSIGADAHWFLPSRTEDGYGLREVSVRRLAEHGTRLLITVDCGITGVREVAEARAAGLDVVVTDHHAPSADGALPEAPTVHPIVCGYPCEELCGTAVAFKLAQALDAPTAAEEIELVALATVADLMPLRGENRRLVREGLSALGRTSRPGLRALMAVARTDPSALTAQVLGFHLAPRINAAGRLRRADAGLELLLTEDGARAGEIADELDRLNVERRAVEQRIIWEAEAQVAELGARSAYVLACQGWHPGVIGIVASRVVERHHRPTILIALDDNGVGQGSGRSIPGFDLLASLHACSDHLLRYGGHHAAAGLTISGDRLGALRAAFESHAEQLLTPDMLEPVQRIDAVVSGSELNLSFAEELELLEPCGIGNPRARLLVPGARFDQVQPIGAGRHARFSVTSGGARARAVSFGCDGKVRGRPGEPLDATFTLERNVWNGAVEPRLVLCEASPCSPPPIEVLGEPSRYVEAAIAEHDWCGSSEPDASRSGRSDDAGGERTVLDRRAESPLAVLADVRASPGEVLAVCADVPRRLPGLAGRAGGFALTSHHAIARGLVTLERFAQLVVLDPPTSLESERLLRCGAGFTHLAWGAAELRFAQQIHELEYGLRASLATLYRSLRALGEAAGEELERLLRGDGPHARPPRLAGRLIKVLAELELVSLDRDLPALAIAGGTPTVLERSPTYRAAAKRYEDGLRFLSRENLRRSA